MEDCCHVSWFLLNSVDAQIEVELNSIFFLKSPELYFKTVVMFIMIISFYLALWITNFASVSERMGSYWTTVTLLPGLFSIVIYMYVVKCAALLKVMNLLKGVIFFCYHVPVLFIQSICTLDTDLIEEVVEQVSGGTVHQRRCLN